MATVHQIKNKILLNRLLKLQFSAEEIKNLDWKEFFLYSNAALHYEHSPSAAIEYALTQDSRIFAQVIKAIEADKKYNALEAFNTHYQNSIHLAIKSNNLEYVRTIVNLAIKTNNIDQMLLLRDDDGNNPLHLAALAKDPQISEEMFIIASSSSHAHYMFSQVNNESNNPMQLLTQENKVELIPDRFLKNPFFECLINANNEGDTLIAQFIALKAVHQVMTILQNLDKKLLQNLDKKHYNSCIKSILSATNHEGKKIYHIAMESGEPLLIETIANLANQAELTFIKNKEYNNELHQALLEKQYDRFTLAQFNHDLYKSENLEGLNLLQLACKLGDFIAIKAIIRSIPANQRVAYVNVKNIEHGNTALHIGALEFNKLKKNALENKDKIEAYKNIAKTLLSHVAKVSITNYQGQTALVLCKELQGVMDELETNLRTDLTTDPNRMINNNNFINHLLAQQFSAHQIKISSTWMDINQPFFPLRHDIYDLAQFNSKYNIPGLAGPAASEALMLWKCHFRGKSQSGDEWGEMALDGVDHSTSLKQQLQEQETQEELQAQYEKERNERNELFKKVMGNEEESSVIAEKEIINNPESMNNYALEYGGEETEKLTIKLIDYTARMLPLLKYTFVGKANFEIPRTNIPPIIAEEATEAFKTLAKAIDEGDVTVISNFPTSFIKLVESRYPTKFLYPVLKAKKVEVLEAVISKFPFLINYQSPSKETLLHLAANFDFADAIPVLLKAEPMLINMQSSAKDTVLQSGVRKGNQNTVNILLVAGASTEIKDANKMNAFQLAISLGKLDVAEILINAGLNAKHTDNLRFVIEQNDIPALQLLLKAKINTKGNNYDHSSKKISAFQLAIILEKFDIAKILLKNNQNLVTKDDWEFVIERNAIKGAELLLEEGINKDIDNFNLAIDSDSVDIASTILDKHKHLVPSKLPYLHYAIQKNAVKVVRLFLERNIVDVKEENAEGLNAFHIAIKHAFQFYFRYNYPLSTIEFLLRYDQTLINIPTKCGITPFVLALDNKYPKDYHAQSIANFLIANGANTKITTEHGHQTVMLAFSTDNKKVIKAVLKDNPEYINILRLGYIIKSYGYKTTAAQEIWTAIKKNVVATLTPGKTLGAPIFGEEAANNHPAIQAIKVAAEQKAAPNTKSFFGGAEVQVSSYTGAKLLVTPPIKMMIDHISGENSNKTTVSYFLDIANIADCTFRLGALKLLPPNMQQTHKIFIINAAGNLVIHAIHEIQSNIFSLKYLVDAAYALFITTSTNILVSELTGSIFGVKLTPTMSNSMLKNVADGVLLAVYGDVFLLLYTIGNKIGNKLFESDQKEDTHNVMPEVDKAMLEMKMKMSKMNPSDNKAMLKTGMETSKTHSHTHTVIVSGEVNQDDDDYNDYNV